jgi:hypothetical protein
MQEVESVQPSVIRGLRPRHVRNATHRNRKAIADKLQAVCDLYAALLYAMPHACSERQASGLPMQSFAMQLFPQAPCYRPAK